MLLSCRDALIDFLPVRSAPLLAAHASTSRWASRASALRRVSWGSISIDIFGRMIAEDAEKSQVDLRHAVRSSRPTTLAFFRAVDGEPHYAFYDEGTASRHGTYRSGAIPFAEIDAIHLGSTALVNGRAAAQTLAMVEDARGSITVSFDPNCRPNLIGNKAEYVRRMDHFATRADIVRLSDSDFAFRYGGSDHAGRAEALLASGTGLFVITRGIEGARAWHRQAGAIEVRAPRVDVVDTIGAATVSRPGFCSLCGPYAGSTRGRSSARAPPSPAGAPVLTRPVFPRSAPEGSTTFWASSRRRIRAGLPQCPDLSTW